MSNLSNPLIGAWRLVSFETRSSTGETAYPFGPEAVGALVYTVEGLVCATVCRPDRPRFAAFDAQRGTPDEYAAAGRAYISYVAEYLIDAEGGAVEHRFRHAAFPNWEGLSQTRYFSVTDDGERLELTTDAQVFGGDTVIAALVWEREP